MAWMFLTWARPGEGKSLDMARDVLALFREYDWAERKHPTLPRRQMFCDLKLSKKIETEQLMFDPLTKMPYPNYFYRQNKKGEEEKVFQQRHLVYWSDIADLKYCSRFNCWRGEAEHPLHDVDIIMDEAQNFAPADQFATLEPWVRKMFAQHRHRGNRIFMNTQDYKSVDINIRRMVGKAYSVRKMFASRDISATLPPPKWIHGLIVKEEYSPDQIEVDGANDFGKLERKNTFPIFFLISKKLVEVYDTTQDIPERFPECAIKCIKCGKLHVTHSFDKDFHSGRSKVAQLVTA